MYCGNWELIKGRLKKAAKIGNEEMEDALENKIKELEEVSNSA